MTQTLRKFLDEEKKSTSTKKVNDVLNNQKWPNAIVPYTFKKGFCMYFFERFHSLYNLLYHTRYIVQKGKFSTFTEWADFIKPNHLQNL